LTKRFWIPHFVFVKDRSLEGTRFLEEVYLREGRIVESALSPERYRTFPRSLLLLLPVLAGAATLWRFYDSYLRQRVVELARASMPADRSQIISGFEMVARLDLAEHSSSREKGRKH
jgi:hypothetical protein